MNTMQNTEPGLAVLGTLRELVRGMAPIASVYLGPPADPADDRAEELALRVRLAVAELERQGADEPTVHAVQDRLTSLASTDGYALFAASGEILFARPLPGVSPTDRVRFAAPAVVVPVLAWLARRPAYVLVVTDRKGPTSRRSPPAALRPARGPSSARMTKSSGMRRVGGPSRVTSDVPRIRGGTTRAASPTTPSGPSATSTRRSSSSPATSGPCSSLTSGSGTATLSAIT